MREREWDAMTLRLAGRCFLCSVVRCVPESGAQVEEMMLALVEQVRCENVYSASWMNVVVVFLRKQNLVSKLLTGFGEVLSSMGLIPLSCKNTAVKHVLSFSRKVFMALNGQDNTLNVNVKWKHRDSNYIMFATTEPLRTSECGHTQRTVSVSNDPGLNDCTDTVKQHKNKKPQNPHENTQRQEHTAELKN